MMEGERKKDCVVVDLDEASTSSKEESFSLESNTCLCNIVDNDDSEEVADWSQTTLWKLKSCGRLTGPLAILLALTIIFLILGREYLIQTLNWLERLSLMPSICVFVALFTLVSFPFGFGYIILNMAAGYLYGLIRGQIVVTLSVAIGFTIAFFICRCCLKNWAMQYVSKSTTLLAMTRILEGPNGFKVILFTRFTPIPFGLQNALFAITDVSFLKTIAVSTVGLFPTQLLNTYMGSTLRNMTEVLADRADGYIILTVQVLFSIGLSYYLIRKARRELSKLSAQAAETVNQEDSINAISTTTAENKV